MLKRLSLIRFRILLLSGYFFFISADGFGQGNASTRCAYDLVLQRNGISYKDLRESYRETAKSAAKAAAAVVYDIPVVVHIVYNDPAYNPGSDIIQDQIDILNDGFRNRFPDTANIRDIFKPLATDAGIRFHLATVDPDGNPTTGITRTFTGLKSFGVPPGSNLDSTDRIKHTATGGRDGWPTDRYLNIWIGNMAYNDQMLDVLGYATPPTNPLPPTFPFYFYTFADGIVLQTQVVGSNNPHAYQVHGGYIKGRTAVHEVGHYLGLQHIFNSCGMYGDGIDDTPEQSVESTTPDGQCAPADKNTCGDGQPGDLPDMWENHMDYSPDACRVMFTKDQVALMRSVLANQRSTLPVTGVLPESHDNKLHLYPNPATNIVIVKGAAGAERIIFRNLLGQNLLTFPGSTLESYDISGLPCGNYLVIAEGRDIRQCGRLVIVR